MEHMTKENDVHEAFFQPRLFLHPMLVSHAESLLLFTASRLAGKRQRSHSHTALLRVSLAYLLFISKSLIILQLK